MKTGKTLEMGGYTWEIYYNEKSNTYHSIPNVPIQGKFMGAMGTSVGSLKHDIRKILKKLESKDNER